MSLLLFSLVILFIFNYRYPFVIEENGAWSLGFKVIDSPISRIIPEPSQLITYEVHNRNTGHQVRFLADPFLIIVEDVYYIFFEEQGVGNANIALYQSTDGVNFKYCGIVLDEEFHLSFPQVFKYKNEFFLLPEARGSGNLLLYKAIDFPNKWELSDTLIRNFQLKDPAILLSDKFNLITASDDNLNQHIFGADSLRGSWKKIENFHTRTGDETRAGGNFFQYKGEWYLPFQNNSEGYGTGLSLYQLNYDSKKALEFEKVVDFQLRPQDNIEWFNRGMHHLNITRIKNNYIAVFDGDKKTGKTKWAWRASLKYNFYDIIRLFQGD